MNQPKPVNQRVNDENSIVRSSIPLQVLCHIHRPIVFLVGFHLINHHKTILHIYILVVCCGNSDLCLERSDWLAIRLDNLWL
jgi:hypothetical protein